MIHSPWLLFFRLRMDSNPSKCNADERCRRGTIPGIAAGHRPQSENDTAASVCGSGCAALFSIAVRSRSHIPNSLSRG